MSTTDGSASSSSAAAQPQPPARMPFWKHLVAGGIAGTSEILIMYPLDVVKTRQQMSVGRAKSEGVIKTLTNTIKTEGFGTYRGILPPIMVEAPKRAIKFAANEQYKGLVQDENGVVDQKGAILAGVGAGITEAFIVVPFELVKIRLQIKENAGKYANTMDAVLKILRSEGPLAFFNGLEATLHRHAYWNGGYFGSIHGIKAALPEPETKGETMLRNFVAGALAGTFGTMLNTPADVVKTRIQNQISQKGVPNKYNWAIPGMVTIAREEGMAALYKGFVPKVMRLGPGGGILLVVFDIVSNMLRDL